MHERKAMMHELADALIALPGGYGTLEELLESITWSQLRIHAKPIGVLDTDGFFRPLLDWIETAHRQGFIDKHSKDILVVFETGVHCVCVCVCGIHVEFVRCLERLSDPCIVNDGLPRQVRDTPEALLEALENYVDPIQGPWLLKEDMWKKRGTGQFSSMDEM